MSTLYLVDDHLLFRDALAMMLTQAGHRVVGVSTDPTQAMADLRDLVPDVLLLDLGLGMRSGFELLADLHRRNLATRTVVMTMSGHPQHVAEALRLGAMAYVLKGSPSTELLAAIESVARGDRHYVGEVADMAVQALATRDEPAAMASLSARERQVVTLVVRGLSSSRIGEVLHLSPKTVDSYRSRLMGKLGVADVTALVRLALRVGLIDIDEP
jgi:two-component system invasion response regulator UvrY